MFWNSEFELKIMMIEEYKETIVVKLGLANDCDEVKQVLSRSIESMREKKLPAAVINDRLDKLKERLKALSPASYDYIHWCNIRCAILYLKGLVNKPRSL
jgi:hypothetical protein